MPLSDAQKIAAREGVEQAVRTLGLSLRTEAEIWQVTDIVVHAIDDAEDLTDQ
jgi:hypothetical protein